jgi:hypothetical protein
LAKSLITTFSTPSHQWLFFGLILCCSQSGDDPLEDLTRFGYKINIKTIKKSYILLYCWLRTCGIMTIFLLKKLYELWLLKSQKTLDFSTFNFGY